MKEKEFSTEDTYKLTIETGLADEDNRPNGGRKDKEGDNSTPPANPAIHRHPGEERKKQPQDNKPQDRQNKEKTREKATASTAKKGNKDNRNEDNAFFSATTLKKVLGGDILSTATVRKQIGLITLIVGFIIIHVAVRYSCQQKLIEIDKLQKELLDVRYKSLSSNSLITEKSRESNVLKFLRENNDSTLKMPSQPPYIINVPSE